MSATSFAISGILSLAMAVWMFVVGRDPKRWRLLWLDFFGILDSDTQRTERHGQEAQVRFMAYVQFMLWIAMFVSCLYWATERTRESLRPKTSVERELNVIRKQVQENIRR
jgi:hypothetical protein